MRQPELARAVGVSQSTISRWLDGRSIPPDKFAPLAEALKVQASWLKLGSGEPPPAPFTYPMPGEDAPRLMDGDTPARRLMRVMPAATLVEFIRKEMADLTSAVAAGHTPQPDTLSTIEDALATLSTKCQDSQP